MKKSICMLVSMVFVLGLSNFAFANKAMLIKNEQSPKTFRTVKCPEYMDGIGSTTKPTVGIWHLGPPSGSQRVSATGVIGNPVTTLVCYYRVGNLAPTYEMSVPPGGYCERANDSEFRCYP